VLALLRPAVPLAVAAARAGAEQPVGSGRGEGTRKETATSHRTRKQKRCFPALLNFGK